MDLTTAEREEFYRSMIAAMTENANLRQLKTIFAFISAFST